MIESILWQLQRTRNFGREDRSRSMDDIDYWRTAAQLMRQHGADAAIEAALRADALLDQGDAEGCRVWTRIVRAINSLERNSPTPNEKLH
jgi:hypothetical protein